MPDTARPSALRPLPQSFDEPLGRKIIEMHVWAVGEGLRGTEAAPLFEGFCRRLVDAGVPLWRVFAGMRTLHPQWGGYGYIWWRHLNAIQPRQFERGDTYEQNILNSPIGELIREAEAFAGRGTPWRDLRRRLVGPEAQLDFPTSTSSLPLAPPTISLRSSALARLTTLHGEPASAIPSRPIGPRDSATTTSCC